MFDRSDSRLATGRSEGLLLAVAEDTLRDNLAKGELADQMAAIAPVFAKHFGASRPALAGIGVASLASPDTLSEIEAVARVPG
jgi:enamine deaminase RidA (YjgF/YER057c/UK114 family)